MRPVRGAAAVSAGLDRFLIEEGTYDITPYVKAGEKAIYLSMIRTTWDKLPLGPGPDRHCGENRQTLRDEGSS